MMRLLNTSLVYLVLGLFSGVFYREYTKALDAADPGQLSTLHTHLLVLGTIVFLVVLALDAIFSLTGRKYFSAFYWIYNAGLALTVVMMVVRGMLTANGVSPAETSAAIPGIAGLGHIILSVGLVLLFIVLREAVKEKAAARAVEPTATA